MRSGACNFDAEEGARLTGIVILTLLLVFRPCFSTYSEITGTRTHRRKSARFEAECKRAPRGSDGAKVAISRPKVAACRCFIFRVIKTPTGSKNPASCTRYLQGSSAAIEQALAAQVREVVANQRRRVRVLTRRQFIFPKSDTLC